MPEQSPAERVKNFREVPFGYPAETAQIEAGALPAVQERPLPRRLPGRGQNPRVHPAHPRGDFIGAARMIKADNALPAVCGRVCPQEDQCEKFCVLGKKGEPVAIGRLERFAADWGLEHPDAEPPRRVAPPTGKRVADRRGRAGRADLAPATSPAWAIA